MSEQEDALGLQVVWSGNVGPHESGGVHWGGNVVIMQFPKEKRPKRPSRGWRRHVRKLKALTL